MWDREASPRPGSISSEVGQVSSLLRQGSGVLVVKPGVDWSSHGNLHVESFALSRCSDLFDSDLHLLGIFLRKPCCCALVGMGSPDEVCRVLQERVASGLWSISLGNESPGTCWADEFCEGARSRRPP